MHVSPPGVAQSRSGHVVPAIYVVGDHVLLRELVRTVLERAVRGVPGGPDGREPPLLPELPASPGVRRREPVEGETAQALFERFANHALLARLRALVDVP